MGVSLKTLKVGDVLYQCRMTRQGNTMMRALSVWKMQVLEVLEGKAKITWNGNPATYWSERDLTASTVRRLPPEWSRRDLMGGRTCYFCGAKQEEGHKATCSRTKKKKEPKGA